MKKEELQIGDKVWIEGPWSFREATVLGKSENDCLVGDQVGVKEIGERHWYFISRPKLNRFLTWIISKIFPNGLGY